MDKVISHLIKEMAEELKGGQKKLDVAEPFGKLTAADFKALRAKKDMEEGAKEDSDARVAQMQKDYKEMYNLGYETGYADAQSGRKPSPMMENHEGVDFSALRAKKGMKEEDSKLEEKVDMEELQMTLKRLKKENPGKKVTYSFVQDSPKGYVFYIDKKLVKEGEDHEVSMANNSIDSIIWAAHELKKYLQGGERDIPAWIQDHITNAENYILQAAKNFHDYGQEEAPEEEPIADEMSLQEMIKKVGSKYNVYSKKGKKLGSHPSKKKAQKQMAAIEISKQGK